MISITPEITGPGIEEEYADALAAIHEIRQALGPQPLTNHTPEGRVSMEISWVEREIAARRLPIPVDQSYVNTIFYLVGSNELAGYDGFQPALGRLWLVVKGYGLLKPRHYLVVAAMIDEFLAEARMLWSTLPDGDRIILDDLSKIAVQLREGVLPPRRLPQDTFSTSSSPMLDQQVANGANRLRAIDMALFDGRRPRQVRKPPLPAPVPGLPDRAPPLPPELEGKLP